MMSADTTSVTTVCMVTYRRRSQLAQILAALQRQNPPVRIWLWNNDQQPLPPDLAVIPDWLIESGRNCFCAPRWWLAAQATSRYVLILDDDLLPATPAAVAHLVARCEPGRCVGPIGAQIPVGCRYRDHIVCRSPNHDVQVDVIKGRCLAGLTETLREALPWSGALTARCWEAGYDDLCVAEDIAVCGAIAQSHYGRHLVPGGIAADWQDLQEGDESLSRRADHVVRRDRVTARWFRDA